MRIESKPSSKVCVTTSETGQATRKKRYAIAMNRRT